MGCCGSTAAARNISDLTLPEVFQKVAEPTNASSSSSSGKYSPRTRSPRSSPSRKQIRSQSPTTTNENSSSRSSSHSSKTLPERKRPSHSLPAAPAVAPDVTIIFTEPSVLTAAMARAHTPSPPPGALAAAVAAAPTSTSAAAKEISLVDISDIEIPTLSLSSSPPPGAAPPVTAAPTLNPFLMTTPVVAGGSGKRSNVSRRSSTQLHHYLNVAALLRTQLCPPARVPSPIDPTSGKPASVSVSLPRLQNTPPPIPESSGTAEAGTFSMTAAVTLLMEENIVASVEEGAQLLLALETMNILRRCKPPTTKSKLVLFGFVNDGSNTNLDEFVIDNDEVEKKEEEEVVAAATVLPRDSSGLAKSESKDSLLSISLPRMQSLHLAYDEKEQCFMIPALDPTDCSEITALASETLASSSSNTTTNLKASSSISRSQPIQIRSGKSVDSTTNARSPPLPSMPSASSDTIAVEESSSSNSLPKTSSYKSPTIHSWTRMGRFAL